MCSSCDEHSLNVRLLAVPLEVLPQSPGFQFDSIRLFSGLKFVVRLYIVTKSNGRVRTRALLQALRKSQFVSFNVLFSTELFLIQVTQHKLNEIPSRVM